MLGYGSGCVDVGGGYVGCGCVDVGGGYVACGCVVGYPPPDPMVEGLLKAAPWAPGQWYNQSTV